ncbi:MAG: hypothetical protein HQK95_02725 [Nitrospirae bacterium]|nr:hypothetical protein [Nitrospirota bacterium]
MKKALKCWEIKKCDCAVKATCDVYNEEMNALKPDPSVVNCWDYLECPESKRNLCEAYIERQGQECWKLTSTRCNDNEILEFNEKMRLCRKCGFFNKHANRHI